MNVLLEFVPSNFARENFKFSEAVYHGFDIVQLLQGAFGRETYTRSVLSHMAVIEGTGGRVDLSIVHTELVSPKSADDFVVRPIGYVRVLQAATLN